MSRRDISLTLALCASLVLHALLLGSVAEVYTVQAGSRIWLPGFPVQEQTVNALLVPLPPDRDDQHLGDSEGHGNATDETLGSEPMQSPKVAPQAQPFLSLDPAGPGKIGDEPTDSILPLGRPGQVASPPTPQPSAQPQMTAAAAAAPPPEQQQDEVQPVGIPQNGGDFALPEIAKPQAVASAAPQTASPEAPTVPTPAPVQQNVPAQPGAEHAADPAPQGDSESDPIATVGSAEFRRGATQVRLGRRHKITRPRLTLGAQADLLTLARPTLVLKLKTDETGKVISAAIFRTSGSNDIDQSVKVEAYNWWFEPPKDNAGKPKSDVLLFAIHFI